MDQHPLIDELVVPQRKEESLWELYHENSKLSPYHEASLSQKTILEELKKLYECLPYEGHPAIALPDSVIPLKNALDEVLTARRSTRNFVSSTLDLDQIGTLLTYAYGVRQKNTNFPRSFRFTPSGGGLFPLELYVYTSHLDGHPPGIYHYHSLRHHLRLIHEGDLSGALGKTLIQTDLIQNASVVIFLTAIFHRSIFKYGERGYRFILLEAGHVAQNINLVSEALRMGCVNIGGFFDRKIDALLGLDGVTQSCLYLIALGKIAHESKPTSEGQGH